MASFTGTNGGFLHAGSGGGGGSVSPGSGSSGWTSTRIPFADSGGILTESNKFNWDETGASNSILSLSPVTNGNSVLIKNAGVFGTEILSISGGAALRLGTGGGAFGQWQINSSGHFEPSLSANTYDIGGTSLTVRNFFQAGYHRLDELTVEPSLTDAAAHLYAIADGTFTAFKIRLGLRDLQISDTGSAYSKIELKSSSGMKCSSAGGNICEVGVDGGANLRFSGSTVMYPGADDTYDLGRTANRFANFFQAGYHRQDEMAAPAAVANSVITYAVDDGGGNTQYVIRTSNSDFIFEDGTIDTITNGSGELRITPAGQLGLGAFGTANRITVDTSGNVGVSAGNLTVSGSSAFTVINGTLQLAETTGAIASADKARLFAQDNSTVTEMVIRLPNTDVIFSDSPQTYTPTNVSTDRSYDADSTSTAELADVLGTLIADLQTMGLLQ
jgi:hypothetical protein